MSEMHEINCETCGILFSIQDKMDKIWRKTEKIFYCPNGHQLCYLKKSENQEIANLRKEINDLNDKLSAAERIIDTQKKKIEDLELELEIYKPASIN